MSYIPDIGPAPMLRDDRVGRASESSSLTPTSSTSQVMQAVEPNSSSPPKPPGRWKAYFEARSFRDPSHGCIWRFFCRQPNCKHHFSTNSSLTPLARHFQVAHHAVYVEICKTQMQGGNGAVKMSSTTLVQTKLDSTSIRMPKIDTIISAALEWMIADLQPFTAMDTPKHRALLNLYNPLVVIPCAATIRGSAPVMVKAAEMAQLTRIPCFAHILHNSVKTAIEKDDAIQALVTRCHKLVTFFHNSPKMAQLLQQEQEHVDRTAPTLVMGQYPGTGQKTTAAQDGDRGGLLHSPE
ncbi:hypothetical protein EDD21DRAFT_424355 [Dissophora ornata]|nr:hypothetical protein EDD21DRAFT_424355 [Dissophora ornata]